MLTEGKQWESVGMGEIMMCVPVATRGATNTIGFIENGLLVYEGHIGCPEAHRCGGATVSKLPFRVAQYYNAWKARQPMTKTWKPLEDGRYIIDPLVAYGDRHRGRWHRCGHAQAFGYAQLIASVLHRHRATIPPRRMWWMR